MIKNLLICVPTHTDYVFSVCTTSLIANINRLNKFGINVKYQPITKEAYVARAKNRAIGLMVRDNKFDAVMIIDYDLGFDEYAISKLIVAEKEFIGGSYPFKKSKGYPASAMIENNSIVTDERGVMRASFVPGGFILINRSVIEKMDEKLQIRESDGIRFYFDEGFVFPDINRWLGEDKVFALRLIQCGITQWIEPRIDFVHVGINGNTGNYGEFMGNIIKNRIEV